MKNSNIYKTLASEGIYGPGSEELKKNEEHLTRYFEREYRRLKENPMTLEEAGISASEGDIMEETDALMSKHYDERPEFFSSFLDNKYMAYSMAYYGETPAEIRNSNAILEDAQTAKFDLIAERAQIKGGEEILNIGCGFGSLEKYLFEHYPDISITSITPSTVQAEYIAEKINQRNHVFSKSNILIEKCAFDKILPDLFGNKEFDIVISVAVFEQVRNMPSVLKHISKFLRPGGLSFHHFITSQLVIPKLLNPDSSLIGKYFPGGRVWPHDEFTKYNSDLTLENSWFLNGLNYWNTLNEWHNRFWHNIDTLHGSVFDTESIKHWNNYFSLCKAVFFPLEGEYYGNSHYLFSKAD